MTQISKGQTFADGQQVTGTRLNQLVDQSTLLVGAITEQPSITANTLQSTDSTIVNDGGVLKEATIGDILNSNLPIAPSSINNATELTINVTDGASVNGVSYTATWSGSAGSIVVTSVAHGLTTNNFVNITSATGDVSENGTGLYKISSVTANTFTLSSTLKFVPVTSAWDNPTSGTLNYVREGSVRTVADSFLSNPVFFNSSVFLSSSSTLNIAGTATAVTQTLNDNSTKLATTEYVNSSNKVLAFARFDGTEKTGTWSQSGSTVTVNINSHNAVEGQPVHFIATSGTFASGNGSYIVVTRPTLNQYTFTALTTATASGNCTQAVSVQASFGLSTVPVSGGIKYNSSDTSYTIGITSGSAGAFCAIGTPSSAASNYATNGVVMFYYTPTGVLTRPAFGNVILCR
jgi:hypothetical protein